MSSEAERRIDEMTSQMQTDFLRIYDVIDPAPDNAALKIERGGRFVAPTFQFAPDGHPWPLMISTQMALKRDMDGWLRACWFVTSNEHLSCRQPIDAVRDNDERVIEAARATNEDMIG